MLSHGNLDLAMGFYFFPWAAVRRWPVICAERSAGTRWKPTVFSGSMGTLADNSNARQVLRRGQVRIARLHRRPVRVAWRRRRDERGGADAGIVRRQGRCARPDHSRSRQRCLRPSGQQLDPVLRGQLAGRPDVVHLHHLTPMHEAVRRVWPGVPVVTHLHGTELKMLSAVQDGSIRDRPGRFNSEWVAADAALGG